MTNKRYITQEDIKHSCLDIVQQMYKDDWRPDFIVGVTRGGLWPAMMLSHYLGIKMYTLDVRMRDGDEKEHCEWLIDEATCGTNILIIDDINDTGETFSWIRNDWGVLENNLRFAALIDNVPSQFENPPVKCGNINAWIHFFPCSVMLCHASVRAPVRPWAQTPSSS